MAQDLGGAIPTHQGSGIGLVAGVLFIGALPLLVWAIAVLGARYMIGDGFLPEAASKHPAVEILMIVATAAATALGLIARHASIPVEPKRASALFALGFVLWPLIVAAVYLIQPAILTASETMTVAVKKEEPSVAPEGKEQADAKLKSPSAVSASMVLATSADPASEQLQSTSQTTAPMPPAIDFDRLSEPELRGWVGQLIFAGVDEPTAASARELASMRVGGFIIYDQAVPKSLQMDAKVAHIQKIIRDLNEEADASASLPPFIAADVEGGNTFWLARLDMLTPLPAAMALGATRSPEASLLAGRIAGREMAALGFNMNFAPVVDVSISSDDTVIGDRSFGGNAQFVARMAGAFADGLRESNIIPVFKHYPGHGSTEAGFHSVRLPKSSFRLSDIGNALIPFRSLLNDRSAVMTSHFSVSAIGPHNISFDHDFVSRLIREKRPVDIKENAINGLGFDGLVIADDLSAPSVMSEPGHSCQRSLARSLEFAKSNAVRAFEAGHDVLMFAHILKSAASSEVYVQQRGDECARWALTVNELNDVIRHLKAHIFDGTHEETARRVTMLRASLKRIARLKARLTRERLSESAVALSRVRGGHQSCSKSLFRQSFMLLPSVNGYDGLDRLSNNDKVFVLFGTRWKTYGAIDELRQNPNYRQRVNVNAEAFDWTRVFRDTFETRAQLTFEMDKETPGHDEVGVRGDYLSDLIMGYEAVSSAEPAGRAFDKVVLMVNKRARWALAKEIILSLDRKGYDVSRVTVFITDHLTMLRDNVSSEEGAIMRQANIVVGFSGYPFRIPLLMDMVRSGEITANEAIPPISLHPLFSTVDFETGAIELDCPLLSLTREPPTPPAPHPG